MTSNLIVVLTDTACNGEICTTYDILPIEPYIHMQTDSFATSDASCLASCDAYAEIFVTNGTPPYQYQWNNGFPVTEFYAQTDSSVYQLTITDANGCRIVADILVGSDQEIFLPQGWSHFSTYINPFGHDDVNLPFEEQGIDLEVDIMKNQDGLVYWPQFNIVDIPGYIPEEGYQIKMKSDQNLYMKGHLKCPEDIIFDLDTTSSTWYHLGYPRTTESLPTVQFAALGNDLIIVKDEDGSVYWQQFGINNIGMLKPGEGYLANVTNNYNFFYQANDNFQGTKTIFAPKDKNKTTAYNDLNTGVCMLLVIPNNSWDTEPAIGDEIKVIGENGQLAGYTIYQGNHSGVVIYGDDITTPFEEGLSEGESFTISLWGPSNKSTKSISIRKWIKGDEKFSEGKISIAGSKNQVDILTDEKNELVFLYPNPSSGLLKLRLLLSEEKTIRFKIYSFDGRIVKELSNNKLPAGEHEHQINMQNCTSGTYTLQLILGNNVKHVKFVIIK